MTTRFYLTCIFLCAVYTINAQPAVLHDADSLFQQHKYFEASIAYERILFSDSNAEQTLYAVKQKIQCLKQQRLFTQAITFIQASRNERLPDSVNYRLYYEQTLCAYLAGNFENALSVVEQVRFSYPAYKDDPKLLLLQILSLNELQQWTQASQVYNSLIILKHPTDTLQSPYLNLPHLKNKDKAQWLSTFIPGGGQVYAGKPLEALVSIIAQGAGIYFGIVSFQQHYYIATWLAGAGLFGSFHLGGVRRSETLVEQYNHKKMVEFNGKVREQLLKVME